MPVPIADPRRLAFDCAAVMYQRDFLRAKAPDFLEQDIKEKMERDTQFPFPTTAKPKVDALDTWITGGPGRHSNVPGIDVLAPIRSMQLSPSPAPKSALFTIFLAKKERML